ncbi:hypothetical protein ACFODL_11925 [Phenylobacterium terrae]|uniref:Uncharacterized protein n=1 Tax=Phenylobacterium terrae TaxID=2665495 RepID=A0ABW4N0U7_9CAUL
MSVRIELEPIYGWGWFDGDIAMAVPERFHLLLDEASGAAARGRTVAPASSLDGRAVELALRGLHGDSAHVGLRIAPHITGFAAVSRRELEAAGLELPAG